MSEKNNITVNKENSTAKVLLRVSNLKKYFPILDSSLIQKHIGDIKAVDDVSFDVKEGETLGLVGESGCGKTTTGRAIVMLDRPTSGTVEFQGVDLASVGGKDLRKIRRNIQMVFQDPFASLNPRLRVSEIVGEPLRVHNILEGQARINRVKELLDIVGINPTCINNFSHEFSGGQRQRIGVARALAVQPKFIVCDEPISALDVSIQAQVINLLEKLQAEFGLTYLFIAHDLAVVRHISDRVAVMYLGKIMELTDKDQLYKSPLHPYTKALLSAVPIPDPVVELERIKNRIILEGDVPSPANPPKGCNFSTRCASRKRVKQEKGIDCNQIEPENKEIKPGHMVACHLFN